MTHHNTEFIIYTCSLFFIYNTKVSMARAALWDGLWLYCILASALLRIPRLKFPSLPCSLAPSLPRSIPPPFASSLPSFPRGVHALFRPFLARSLRQPSLPQPSLPPLTLSPCLASSLPPSLPPSLPVDSRTFPWVASDDSQSLLEREPTRSKDRGLLSYNIDVMFFNYIGIHSVN